MRVLHLTWEYPPVVHGGLGRHVDSLTRAQVAAGHHVTVVAPADDVIAAVDHTAALRETRHGVDVRRVSLRPGPSVTDARTLVEAMHAMQADMACASGGLAIDVVHAHDWMVADAGRAVADATGAPLVVTVHATEYGRRFGRLDEPGHLAVHAAERRAVSAADRLVVCSAAMVHELVNHHGGNASEIDVVPGAVDARRWRPDPDRRAAARARWADGPGPLVVAAGRLEWEKGLSTLLRAAPALVRADPSTRVVIAGRGSYQPVLAELVRALAIEPHVRFCGRLDEAELAALMAAADAVVVPSRYEPFGLVALEAQAVGAPVVVTRTGGLAELVEEGRTGRVIRPGDVDRLAEVVRELLDDPVQARRLAAAGRRAAAARTWQAVARRTDEVYARALASWQQRSAG